MPYKVGLRTLPYCDKTRTNWEGTAPRPMGTDIWYPAVDTAVATEIFFGPQDAPLFKAGLAARQAGLVPSPAEFPLIMLSHGTGGSAFHFGWLASFLASKGYIVAGVNHHGNTALEPYSTQGFLLWWERAKDLTTVLTRILEDVTFGARINRQKIGAAGFSLGGTTAIVLAGGLIDLQALGAVYQTERDILRLMPPEFPDSSAFLSLFRSLVESDTSHQASYHDERVRAAFAIAPALGESFTASGLASVEIPIKIVVGEADASTPAPTNGGRFASLIKQAELVILEGQVAHYTFLAEATALGKQVAPEICVDHPSVNRPYIHKRVSECVSEFFDKQLAVQ